MKKTRNRTDHKTKPGSGYIKAALSDEELWAAYSSKIKPLTVYERNTNIRLRDLPYVEPPRSETVKQRQPVAIKPAPKAPFAAKPYEHGKADGLDRTSQKKMRRGKIEIEARLDLHGMIQTEAHASLLSFMERAYQSGKRSVLVITGKGVTRHGDIGVLRKAVPKWLNETPLKSWIRGFDYAAPSDGGEGALYILLRRKR